MALGTYATPAALLRSGVGPSEELARHAIPPTAIVHGVGRGMQDHPKVSYRFDLGIAAPPWPSPWYQCLLTGAHEVEGERRVYQVMPYSGQVEGGHRFTDLNVQVADARSRRGAVRLQSTDPADQPALEMGWFLEPSDRAAAVAAGRRLMEVARAAPLAGVLTPWPHLDDPDHVLRTVETFHHPVGSCRMGRADDPEAVVDARGALRAGGGLGDGRLGDRARALGQHPSGRDRPRRAPVRRLRRGGRARSARHNPGSRALDARARPGARIHLTATPEGHMPDLPPPADPGTTYTAVIETNAGEIQLELWADKAPQTVGNFVGLARQGFYDGTTFHRVIRDFMIQGGCPQGTGTGGPGYNFADEINDEKLVSGVLAMANAGPNTNGSQFFIITASATPWLDGAHTGFGRVTGGQEVVDALGTTPTGRGDRPVETQTITTIRIEEG